MGKIFWIRRYLTVFAVAVGMIAGAQLLRGHTVGYSAMHGLIWGAISSTIFIATRMYYARRGLACAMCQDIPEFRFEKKNNQ
jgi:hypothetical protein